MTLNTKENFICDCCGESFSDNVLVSTNEFGYKDLDTRPAPMKRSTMSFWIHQCPNCGYILHNKRNGAEFREYIESDEYKTCEGMNFKNDLAVKFYKDGLLFVQKEDYLISCLSFLKAAWVFDDLESLNEAIHCRNKFLECFDKLNNDEKILDIELIRLDVLRRAGKFDIVINDANPEMFDQEIMYKIAKFEIKKSQEKDDKCYTIEEVI